MRTLLLALLFVACSAPEKPKVEHPESHGDPGLARTLIGQADDATKAGDFDKARKLLHRAEAYADVPVRAEIDQQAEATDEAEAESLADEPKATAKKGDCRGAVGATAELATKSEGVAKFLPLKVGKSIAKCIRRLAEDDLTAARKLIDEGATRKAMSSKKYKALRKDVLEKVEAAVDKQLGPMLQRKDFDGVAAMLANAAKSGLMHEDEADRVRDKMREQIAASVAEVVKKAAEAKKLSGSELGVVDALLKAGWPDEKARPAALLQKRAGLALVIACHAIRCHEQAAKKRWAFGNLGVSPVADPKAAAAASLKSGTPVWELATGGGLSLVATSDPGAPADMPGRAAAAAGWVPSKGLQDVDTSEMLPPGNSLIGTRVWGPLREHEKNLELGTVIAISGTKAKVRRLADRVEVEVARGKLHFGVIKQGTKVMGLCSKPDAIEPALIDSVKDIESEQLDPQVTLSCLDKDGKPMGVLKQGVLGSIRMPPGWVK